MSISVVAGAGVVIMGMRVTVRGVGMDGVDR